MSARDGWEPMLEDGVTRRCQGTAMDRHEVTGQRQCRRAATRGYLYCDTHAAYEAEPSQELRRGRRVDVALSAGDIARKEPR